MLVYASLTPWTQTEHRAPTLGRYPRFFSLRRAALSVSRVSAQTSAASRATEQASAAERLTQLGELVDAGLVTDAEYEEKRQSIVSQL